MTDLRNLTILGLLGRLNGLIDEGETLAPCEEVRRFVRSGKVLDRLRERYGDFPEFSPLNKAEATLLRNELIAMEEKFAGREEDKMGVSRNGLCLLAGYCLEMLIERHIREVTG